MRRDAPVYASCCTLRLLYRGFRLFPQGPSPPPPPPPPPPLLSLSCHLPRYVEVTAADRKTSVFLRAKDPAMAQSWYTAIQTGMLVLVPRVKEGLRALQPGLDPKHLGWITMQVRAGRRHREGGRRPALNHQIKKRSLGTGVMPKLSLWFQRALPKKLLTGRRWRNHDSSLIL